MVAVIRWRELSEQRVLSRHARCLHPAKGVVKTLDALFYVIHHGGFPLEDDEYCLNVKHELMGDVASLRFVRLIGHRECDRVMLHVARRTQDSIVEAAAAPVSSNQPEFERSFARFCHVFNGGCIRLFVVLGRPAAQQREPRPQSATYYPKCALGISNVSQLRLCQIVELVRVSHVI